MPVVTATPLRAGDGDVPALAATLTRAFADDPVTVWTCPHGPTRRRMLHRYFRIFLRQALRRDEVWTTSALTGAALWMPPERWRQSTREVFELAPAIAFARIVARLPLLAAGIGRIELAHARQSPHYYLAVLGTEPAHQGQGVGSAVLGPALAQCDADGVGAYLETATQRNVAFYARHGFHVDREIALPRGPVVYTMWREPRA